MNSVGEPVSTPEAAPRRCGKPLLPVRGVCSILDCDEDQVLRLLQEGKLAWSFDVSLRPKSGSSRELRVLQAAVVSYMQGRPCELQWADVFRLLLPEAPT